ncbi:MAG: LLM class flavin-dependent oxidoreductase [Gammaproteobacteria bacterium]
MLVGLTPWAPAAQSASALTTQAAVAESLGYESFWLPENHFNPQAIPDPLMPLAAVAAGTTSIRLATTSYLLPLRNPLLAAEQVAVLDRLSGGRVLLGVGRGYSRDTLAAFDVDPGRKRERFEWSLDLMRRAWRGEEVSLYEDGRAAVSVAPRPVQLPHPPIWVAAFGPKALAQVGRLGLPYLASPVDTFAELEANFARFDEALAAAGHPPMTTRPVMRTIFVSREQAALRAVRESLERVRLPRGLALSPDIDAWAVIGEPAAVADRLAACREALAATHLVATHFRIDGIAERHLRASVEQLPALLG